MTFDHEWDSLRTFVTVSEYTRQTGNAVGDYHEAPEFGGVASQGGDEMVRAGVHASMFSREVLPPSNTSVMSRWSRSPTGCPPIPRWWCPTMRSAKYGGTAFIGRMSRLNWSWGATCAGQSAIPATSRSPGSPPTLRLYRTVLCCATCATAGLVADQRNQCIHLMGYCKWKSESAQISQILDAVVTVAAYGMGERVGLGTRLRPLIIQCIRSPRLGGS